MTYIENLYFIASCLSISSNEKNKEKLISQLKSNIIEWDKIVKISSSHYVLPALYCNLKKQNLLHFLPKDLTKYFKYISDLNKERNKQIIIQANLLNDLLLANNIAPVFMKGTGNLLAGLYDDISERMVGDIDFIVSKEDYFKTISILKSDGYSRVGKNNYFYPLNIHYPKLKKENNIAAVEIHNELVSVNYKNEFNYSFINKDCQVIEGFKVLSYSNKLILSIISNQVVDHGYYYYSFPLKNAYDVFLLSKKTDTIDAIKEFDKLFNPLNCFLASCSEVFSNTSTLNYINTKKTNKYMLTFVKQYENLRYKERRDKRKKVYLTLKYRISQLYNTIINKDCRIWAYKRLTDKNRNLDFWDYK